MSIPVAIEAGLTAAVSAFNAAPSDAGVRQCEQYRSVQYAQNFAENQASVRSLADQLDVAKQVSAQLLQLADQHGTASVAAIAADEAAGVAWQNGRQATIEASVASQVASVVATVP